MQVFSQRIDAPSRARGARSETIDELTPEGFGTAHGAGMPRFLGRGHGLAGPPAGLRDSGGPARGAPALQLKGAVDRPGDPLEEEADRIAEEIMARNVAQSPALAAPAPGRTPEAGAENRGSREGDVARRLPVEEEMIQRAARDGGACPACGAGTPADRPCEACARETERPDPTTLAVRGTSGPGQPLDAGTRSFMEHRFGQEFGNVRIHADAPAAAAADALNARAFTHGRNIAFASQQFAPETGAGRRLIAHELTHVVQQGASGSRTPGAPVSAEGPVASRGAAPAVQRDQWEMGRPLWLEPRPSRFEQARDACNNRLNWSDGGHWIGSGPEPDCSMTETRSSSHTITNRWPTEEDAVRAHEHASFQREVLGYTAGGLITVLTAGASTPLWASLLAGFGGGVIANHVPSVLDLVRSGDTLTIRITMSGTRSAHPWGRREISTSAEWSLVDRDGNIKWGVSDYQVLGRGELSESEFDTMFNALPAS